MSIFGRKKGELNINTGKVYTEWKKIKTIPEKSTSDAATEESSELEKSKDASVLKQCKETYLLTHEK